MHAWEQIQITIDYIETHISKKIAISDLAKLASLSPFYYQRLFRRLVKKPVNEYIKLRRLARACEVLADKDKRIVDIALEFGFSAHTAFTRTFKEAFGITPEDFRKNPVRLNNFGKPELLLNYKLVDENVPLITNEIVIEITRKQLSSPEHFIGLTAKVTTAQIPVGVETGVDTLGKLWNDFHESKSTILALVANGDELGVSMMGEEEGYFTYFAGALAQSNDKVDGYTHWKLPHGEYIVCTFEGENFEQLMDALYKAQGYLFGTWLPNHHLITEPFCAERYKSHTADTTSMEIWVRPISS
ncbi:MAG: AraC family transcriptional regulator [Eubacteriaceae bacterium]